MSVTTREDIDDLVDEATKAANRRAFELITAWFGTLTPEQADDVWLYLDGCDISELIARVAPRAASYQASIAIAKAVKADD